MADKILCDKTDLVNIANAVRSKNGTSNTYYVSELGTAVQNIQTAPSLQAKEVNITANGTTNVAADAGYDGLSGVTVNTSVAPETVKIVLRRSDTYHNCEIYFSDGSGTIQHLASSDSISIDALKNSVICISTDNSVYLSDLNSGATVNCINIGNYRYLFCSSDKSAVYQLGISCLIAGTLITLADGTTKPIEEITYDDDLLVWDFFNGCFASAKPRWIKVKQTAEVYNKLTFDNGATLGLVGEGGTQGYHRIFNKQACCFTHTGVPETPNGTITFAEDKSEPVLVSQELIHDAVDYYNIITDKHFNLFANGILTSCKCSNMYRIEDMKYVGERLMSDEDIETDFAWRESLKLPNSKGGAIL